MLPDVAKNSKTHNNDICSICQNPAGQSTATVEPADRIWPGCFHKDLLVCTVCVGMIGEGDCPLCSVLPCIPPHSDTDTTASDASPKSSVGSLPASTSVSNTKYQDWRLGNKTISECQADFTGRERREQRRERYHNKEIQEITKVLGEKVAVRGSESESDAETVVQSENISTGSDQLERRAGNQGTRKVPAATVLPNAHENGGEQRSFNGMKVYVTNLPHSATGQAIRRLFEAYGVVLSVRLFRKNMHQFAAVIFKTKNAGRQVLELDKKIYIEGRRLFIQEWKTVPRQYRGSKKKMEKTESLIAPEQPITLEQVTNKVVETLYMHGLINSPVLPANNNRADRTMTTTWPSRRRRTSSSHRQKSEFAAPNLSPTFSRIVEPPNRAARPRIWQSKRLAAAQKAPSLGVQSALSRLS